MGTLTGHLVPGVAITLLGLWHLLNTIKSFKLAGDGAAFTSRPWFPLATKSLRHLELHLILASSLLAAILQLISFEFDGIEHATMFLHLSIYAFAAIFADLSPTPDAFHGLTGALAASAFAQELFLLHFHSADHVGLEGHYHWLLQLVVVASLSATAVGACFPSSFPAALVRSASVMMQGVWFVNMGFALWVPRMVARGCYSTGKTAAMGAVGCATEAAARRAVALANLQFSWVVAGVAALTALLCLRPEWKCMGYRRLRPLGADAGRILGEGRGLERAPCICAESNITNG